MIFEIYSRQYCNEFSPYMLIQYSSTKNDKKENELCNKTAKKKKLEEELRLNCPSTKALQISIANFTNTPGAWNNDGEEEPRPSKEGEETSSRFSSGREGKTTSRIITINLFAKQKFCPVFGTIDNFHLQQVPRHCEINLINFTCSDSR
ncbi:hypothetical protein WN51_03432 [Melipona quadrifasciata]|uniref:Uncharacterized protein n=1 Tax=Melipona quadrifasciata TaxID=166423 RepID=A0A0N0U7N0_9HYME|nr:hypothetical protein WN51_03432 [Melipona quadrifasciata]